MPDTPSPAAASGRAARPGWLTVLAALAALAVAVPVLSVAANVFAGGTGGTWSHLASTVLGEYVATTLALVAGVGLGTALLGVSLAWAVTHLDFPGRRALEWALVLPLAMPAYVVGSSRVDLQACKLEYSIVSPK